MYWLIACQETRVEDEASDEEEAISEGYASLDGGSGEDSGEDDDARPPTSPNVDEKSAKRVWLSRMVMRQLRVTVGPYQDNILEAVVTPNQQPACFVVSRVLFSKLADPNWRIIQSHNNGDTAHIYIKMRTKGLQNFHRKRYQWMGEQVTFCKVNCVLPLTPDPMDVGPLVKLF